MGCVSVERHTTQSSAGDRPRRHLVCGPRVRRVRDRPTWPTDRHRLHVSKVPVLSETTCARVPRVITPSAVCHITNFCGRVPPTVCDVHIERM